MKRYRNMIIVMIFIISIILLYMYSCHWVILPTKSSPNTLTLVEYGYIAPSKIIFKQYVDNVHICDYVLDLKVELRHQTVQTYELPSIKAGRIEIFVELKNGGEIIKTNYAQANNLRRKGLLIYSTNDFVTSEEYVYFVSGENIRCYNNKLFSKWSYITDPPKLKKITKQEISYSPYYGWKDNKWIVIEENGNEQVTQGD